MPMPSCAKCGRVELSLSSRSSLQIGIDLGGTKTEVAVLGADHAFLLRHRVSTPTERYQDILRVIAELVGLARTQCQMAPDVPVGIGIPGCIDPTTQRVRGANTQVLNGERLQQDLEQRLGCKVCVENDANCLALSESVDGAAAQAQVVFAVILGTGCGGGLALNQKVWRGKNALAGEWGHNPLPWPSADELAVPPCWCGQVGCIETWLSGPGFAQDHARACGVLLQPEALVAAMRAKDEAATRSFLRYADRLARALAQVVNLLDPDVIVIGGGMSQVSEIYSAVPALMGQHTFTRPIHTPVVQAMHGDSSGVRGAAWLCGAELGAPIRNRT